MKKFLIFIVLALVAATAFIVINNADNGEARQPEQVPYNDRHTIELTPKQGCTPDQIQHIAENINIYRSRMEQMGCKIVDIQSNEQGAIVIEYESENPDLIKSLLMPQGEFAVLYTYDVEALLPYISHIDKMLQETYRLSFSDLINTSYANGCIIGAVSYSNMLLINEYVRKDEFRAMLPADLVLSWSTKPDEAVGGKYLLYALRGGNQREVITSSDIKHAYVSVDQDDAFVNVELTPDGCVKFERMTSKIAQQTPRGGCLAITIDGKVYLAPGIKYEITTGIVPITGLSIEEAEIVSHILSSGAAPVPMNVLSNK